MRFSIVTPVFNAEKYLREMLESVKIQSFTDWELVIVDDGSQDNSSEIIKAYAESDSRIRPYFLKENSGSDFYPRQLAIENSLGEYIVNIDADDTVDSNYLLNLDKKIKATDAQIVYCDMFVNSEHSEYDKLIPKNAGVYTHVYQGRDIFDMALLDWQISGVAATQRCLALNSLSQYKSLFESDPEWNSFDNENLTRLDLFLAEKVAFCDSKYFYRQQKDSVTHKISSKRFGLLKADMNLCEFSKSNFGDSSPQHSLSQAQLFNHTIELIRLLNGPDSFEGKKKAAKIAREAFSYIRRDLIKNKVSSRYFLLSGFGFRVTKLVMKLYGR